MGTPHRLVTHFLCRWNVSAAQGWPEQDFQPVYAVQALRAYLELGCASADLLHAAEGLYGVGATQKQV